MRPLLIAISLLLALPACERGEAEVVAAEDHRSTVAGIEIHIPADVMSEARDGGVDAAEVVTATVNNVAPMLDSPPTDVYLQLAPRDRSEDSVRGFTNPVAEHIIIWVQEGRSDVEGMFRWVPSVLAHELHHSARMLRGPGYGETLAQTIVSEGAAAVFSQDVYPRPRRELTRRECLHLWQQARNVLTRRDTDTRHNRWFGELDEDFPSFAGYSVGYELVSDYLETNDLDAASTTDLTARRIIEGAGPEWSLGRAP